MALSTHIQSLEEKHQSLEAELNSLKQRPSVSDIEVSEVKRQKLHLKDEIARLKAEAA